MSLSIEIPNLTNASCADSATPELWFPHPADDRSAPVAICQTCPIRQACLDYAIDNKMDGVWGGVLLARGREVPEKHSGGE